MRSQFTQIAVCPIHWDIYFKYSPKQAWLSDLITSTLPADQYFLNSLRQRTKEECITILNQALREITVDVLALDDVDQVKVDDGLFALGLDSLMAIEIRNRIHDKLQCPTLNLSIEYFINEPSIGKIAKNIVEELQNSYDFDNKTVTQSVENSIREEVSLCDFQYVFWVLNKLDYPYNIGIQLQVHGKLNKEYSSQAFDFVVKQNSAFWLNFNKDAPIQTLKKQGQFKLIYKDISLNDGQNGAKSGILKQYDARMIPLTKQPLIRVYLYKINSDLHELHIVIPHIIVDGPSCDIVFSQFKQCIKRLPLEKN